MNTQQSGTNQHAALNSSILSFNSLICAAGDAANWIMDGEQEIQTFISCGLKLIVASSQCDFPLATSVEILTRLAYSDHGMKDLGKYGQVTLRRVPDDANSGTTVFILSPDGTTSSHVEIVIHDNLAYVLLPCCSNWEQSPTDRHWLRDRIFMGILEGADL